MVQSITKQIAKFTSLSSRFLNSPTLDYHWTLSGVLKLLVYPTATLQNPKSKALSGEVFYSENSSIKTVDGLWRWLITPPPHRSMTLFSRDNLFIQRYTLLGTEEATIWQLARLQKFRWDCFNARRGGLIAKRLFDIAVSATVLTLLGPLFLMLALLIRLETRGPIFFGQTRVGKRGSLFKMWKFRSMYADAEQRKAALMKFNEMGDGVLFKMKNDPRITQIGKFLRKFSLDELPQLWNVLIGDMSLVGPRPPLPNEVAKYTPYQRQRLDVVPGITCIWQVSGRSKIPFPRQVEMDLQYIVHQSFLGDLTLLLKTVPAVLKCDGAY